MIMKFAKKMKLVIGLIVVGICLAGIGNTQEFRATLSGTVTDTTGAVVPSAAILVREIRKGTVNKTISDSAGQYVVPFLQPGEYEITITATGFRTFTRSAMTLQSAEHPIINVELQVGNAAETVTVSSNAPLLDQASSSAGQVITASQVEDLPLSGRTPAMLAQLAVGVIATAQPVQVHPFDNNAGNSWSIGGTPNQTSEVLLDGSPDTTWAGSVAYSPTQDSVQEVSVRAFDTDASVGHTIGGAINQITKSGTNQLHGSIYEFSQISGIGANSWFNKNAAVPVPRPTTHFNQYGVTVGGPVFIPPVFNGKDKLFFFFAWEGLKDGQPKSNLTTVPTAAERAGDFSALLAGGCPNGLANDPTQAAAICNPDATHSSAYADPNQLYDPYSATMSGNQIVRKPILNNNLLSVTSALNPVGLAYLKFLPEPNTTGTSVGSQNYLSNPSGTNDYNNQFGRLDWNISSRNHLFIDVRHNLLFQETSDFLGNGITAKTLQRENWGAVLDEVFTFNPTTVFDVRANWTFFGELHGTPASAYSPGSVGLPDALTDSSQYVQLPYVAFTTNGSSCSTQSFQCLGYTGASIDPSQNYQLFGDVVKVLNRHTLKFGIDARQYRVSAENYGASSGSFTFGDNFLTSGSSGAHVAFGADLAALLLGLPTGGSYFQAARADYSNYYYGVFVQDDWHVNDQLTLNLGLRFDYDTPYGEKLGRTVSGFDPAATNGVSLAAESNYAAHPAAPLPAGAFKARGGLTFPSANGGAPYQVESRTFSPRIGFSFSPARLYNHTVIRGGFGIFVNPATLASDSATGVYSTTPITNQQGFSATTSLVATNDNYLTPATTLSNPFPNGFSEPTGSADGVNTYLGQGISFMSPVEHDPYSERWDLGVQQTLTPNTLVEILYIGNHGVHLPWASQNINSMGRQYLSTLPYRDVALNSAYSASVANPFANLLPGTSLNGAKISVANLLAPYPEFGSITEQNQTIGQSYFHSANIRLEQRMSHGLNVVANYSFSKMIEANVFLNDQDPAPTRRIATYDATHHFALASTYHLPFGRGRAVSFGGSRLWDEIFGGFTVNGIYRYQGGNPVYFSADIPLQPGATLRDITINPRQVNGEPALDTTTFVTGSATSSGSGGFVNGQFAYHLRTLPQTLSWVRADGINNLDASLLKDFRFTEKAYLQLRFETFNTLNHATFKAPAVTGATSSSFGRITAQANTPRSVQIGGRIVF
jgi:hypothetical protein